MIEVKITDDMLIKARNKAKEMGAINNSILRGNGNIAGFIGEQIALDIIGGKWENTYQYDILLDNNIKVDVKTKQTTVKPLPHYDCSIAQTSSKQACDWYVFTRVKKDFSIGWFLGAMSKKQYFEDATFLRKGEVDPSNNFTVRADCYNLPIHSLNESIN
jgi:hypothetical protein